MCVGIEVSEELHLALLDLLCVHNSGAPQDSADLRPEELHYRRDIDQQHAQLQINQIWQFVSRYITYQYLQCVCVRVCVFVSECVSASEYVSVGVCVCE